MSEPAPAAALFREEPARWGLRGDPWLWREMRERFERVACPATPEAVAALAGGAFAELTGVPLSHPEPVYVERYDHGGMSGGHVDPRFWRETALPLLQSRIPAR
ncbi:MAG: hypothetical protein ACJ8GN_15080 [Longimicrobiaceae bacterium]